MSRLAASTPASDAGEVGQEGAGDRRRQQRQRESTARLRRREIGPRPRSRPDTFTIRAASQRLNTW